MERGSRFAPTHGSLPGQLVSAHDSVSSVSAQAFTAACRAAYLIGRRHSGGMFARGLSALPLRPPRCCGTEAVCAPVATLAESSACTILSVGKEKAVYVRLACTWTAPGGRRRHAQACDTAHSGARRHRGAACQLLRAMQWHAVVHRNASMRIRRRASAGSSSAGGHASTRGALSFTHSHTEPVPAVSVPARDP